MKLKKEFKLYSFTSLLIVILFAITLLSGCVRMYERGTTSSSSSNMSSSNMSSSSNDGKKCNMDIECGVGYKCSAGVCTGGIVPEIKGECITGNFGKRVCSNTGKECHNSSECWK